MPTFLSSCAVFVCLFFFFLTNQLHTHIVGVEKASLSRGFFVCLLCVRGGGFYVTEASVS